MAMPLAPYHDGMRIGQGFNSFTQEIRMDSAVISETPGPSVLEKTEAISTAQPGSDVSQIVSYSARFVEKLTEVTTAMNISGPMSIKAGVVGGSMNGSYIDSDKFRHADLNYFVQVKVTNQPKPDREALAFNPMPNYDSYTPESFTELYGDSFVSGFVEGGEFDAIISIKAHEGTNIEYLRYYVERVFSSFGEPKADEQTEVTHQMHDLGETTIVVNWSGGGFIKPSDTLWTLENIPKIAANFASHASVTPQKLYAILTPYLSLRTFRIALPGLRPLDYTNASIYTGELVDCYMEYRFILSNLRNLAEMIRSGEAEIKEPSIPDEVQQLLEDAKHHQVEAQVESDISKLRDEHKVDELDEDDKARHEATLADHAEELRKHHWSTVEDQEHMHTYQPTLLGLERARRDCRAVMLQIVNEVDQITHNPTLAEEPDRHPAFLSPDIFIQIIPKYRKYKIRENEKEPSVVGESEGCVSSDDFEDVDGEELEHHNQRRLEPPKSVSGRKPQDHHDGVDHANHGSENPPRKSQHSSRGANQRHLNGGSAKSEDHDHPSSKPKLNGHSASHQHFSNGHAHPEDEYSGDNEAPAPPKDLFKTNGHAHPSDHHRHASDRQREPVTEKPTKIYEGTMDLFPAALRSLSTIPASLGSRFRMSGFGGLPTLPSSRGGVVFFNDLESLRGGSEARTRLRHVHVWWADGAIAGVHTHLADGRALGHGTTPPKEEALPAGAAVLRPQGWMPVSSNSLTVKGDERIIAVKFWASRRPAAKAVAAAGRPRDRKAIVCMRLVTSGADAVDFWNPEVKYTDAETYAASAPGPEWGLVGFYGEYVEDGGKEMAERWECDSQLSSKPADYKEPCVFERLGVIWGKQ